MHGVFKGMRISNDHMRKDLVFLFSHNLSTIWLYDTEVRRCERNRYPSNMLKVSYISMSAESSSGRYHIDFQFSAAKKC